ncbi:lipopolysaccharide biosynthesis protein [Bradyrhizobium quebecense]|uniref:Oligosaccharide flippase family protein n=2 Tax=Bradyrhizobium quebecense TaxID=2748629 RepID=A0ACD3V6T2_9BRAD|nr:oligosaccharide flippase family protein [Bradyrhizobium quebecense]UGY02136.1 oligosaccharide flippase family protein [Bradyrhizobium quebecense]
MSLRKQAVSLAIMHAADVLQPLLILPYAGRVLGPLHFGLYAYALSVGWLAATIVEYGFHWTAQRAAASARDEPAAIASLLAEVTATKAVLCCVVMLVGVAASDGLIAVSKPMFLCAMLTSVGGILFPTWLFIGLERAWQAAIAVVVGRSLALVCFLMMVTSSAQIELAVAIQSSIGLVAAVVSLPFIVPVGFSGFRAVTPSMVGLQLRNGWRGFLFTLVERMFVALPVPLVEHFSGYVAAGNYSIAEKFVNATRPFFRAMWETLLPRVAYCARHDPEAGLALIRRSLLTLVIGAAFSLFLFFIAPYVILLLFGESFSGAIPIVRVMSVIPVLINANTCTSNLYMFNYGHERAWAILNVSSLLIFLAVAYLLSQQLSNAAIAVAVALIAREFFVLVVSAGFFLVFGTARAQGPATQDDGKAHASDVAAGAVLASRGQLRSER